MEKVGIGMNAHVTPDFWKGKRVLLTGHTGFKGSWLSLWLQSMGADLYGYALESPTSPSLFEQAEIAEGMTSVIGDIRDFSAVKKVIYDCQPDIIIHMAAQPLVRYSYDEPIETYAVNVMGTVNLLDAVRQLDKPCVVINVTTDKCYENREWVWGYRENEAMGGYDPYSSSKGCAELVTSAYRRSFFQNGKIAVASARAGNVIGGGDWADNRLIPDILAAFENNRPVMIRNPRSIRPWQHVLEPLSGYMILAEKLYEDKVAYAEGWNFGPLDTDCHSVQWIVEKMAGLWYDEVSWSIDDSDAPHEANYLKLDISKASAMLNWSPQWGLLTALDKIIDWHQCWLSDGNIKRKCLQQIKQYQELQ